MAAHLKVVLNRRDTPKISHNVRFPLPQEVVEFMPAPAFRRAATPKRAPGEDSQLPLQHLHLDGAPRESILQRVVLALKLPLRGAVSPHGRGLHARQRRVSPACHRPRPHAEAPRGLVGDRLTAEDLQHCVLTVWQTAARYPPPLTTVRSFAGPTGPTSSNVGLSDAEFDRSVGVDRPAGGCAHESTPR